MSYDLLVKRIGILEKQTRTLGLRIQKNNELAKQYSTSQVLREHHEMKADQLKQQYKIKIGILQELKKVYKQVRA